MKIDTNLATIFFKKSENNVVDHLSGPFMRRLLKNK